jgi:hypothetical protein
VRTFEEGREAGRSWLKGAALQQLSIQQLLALPEHVAQVFDGSGEFLHKGGDDDRAADAYAAVTGDLDCRSRATIRDFWARALPDDLGAYGEEFFRGFLAAVAGGAGA